MKIFAVSVLLGMCALVCAAQSSDQKIDNATEMKFTTVPNAPTCSTAAVEHGDPGNGPSTMLVKAKTGCDVPMHWHTPVEQILMVSGLGEGREA